MPKVTIEVDVSERDLERVRVVLERAAALQKTMKESFGMDISGRACIEAVLAFSPDRYQL